ncbi:hypothetical protein CHS0354_021833 [Potamilus streckersoni]|uniref:Uncharacterized protein n=1 Tax=Potamilus streckersoni TaxID=2493646 RepID=A0AAE0RQX1_9BIVA|nr:hypothetical protein CHS0354_021833 [Potamilus streckersoni]
MGIYPIAKKARLIWSSRPASFGAVPMKYERKETKPMSATICDNTDILGNYVYSFIRSKGRTKLCNKVVSYEMTSITYQTSTFLRHSYLQKSGLEDIQNFKASLYACQGGLGVVLCAAKANQAADEPRQRARCCTNKARRGSLVWANFYRKNISGLCSVNNVQSPEEWKRSIHRSTGKSEVVEE